MEDLGQDTVASFQICLNFHNLADIVMDKAVSYYSAESKLIIGTRR